MGEEIDCMRRIENVAVIGMGALGLLFGQRIYEGLGDRHFCFLMDEERAEKHKKDVYTINGKEVRFPILSDLDLIDGMNGDSDEIKLPDLFIVATKYSGLRAAGQMIKAVIDASADRKAGFTGEDDYRPTVISLLNGITSEEILSEFVPRDQIIDCIALGMDAVREGTNLTYENMGRLRIGLREKAGDEFGVEDSKGLETRLDLLSAFFKEVDLPYEIRDDITHDMWNKLMMNVGINQACMVHEVDYGGALNTSPAKEDLYDAMHEVIKIANLEGVELTEEDYEWNMSVFKTLNPEGTPSMRQDALAERPSEVELFAGTMLKYASKHGVSVPVNEKFYRIIKEIESNYRD